MDEVTANTADSRVSLPRRDWHRGGVFITATFTILVIGWFDYITGWELSLYLFYAAPILFVVWRGEKQAAIYFALLCGLVWWLANEGSNPYKSVWSYRWASVSRTVYFLLVAAGGNALRAKQDADRARIEALERARRLEREILSAGEREQQRIGRDLHDGLCQQLAAIGCAARSLADSLRAEAHAEAQEAEKIESYVRDSVMQARNMARGILPVVSGGSGLAASLEELAETTSSPTGVKVTFHEEGEVRVDDLEVAMHLYRIAQEALNNAVRHSGARTVTLSLGEREGVLRLSIADDGRGIGANSESHGGLGFLTMEFRSRAIGAKLSISRRVEGGTVVDCACKLANAGHHGIPE